MLGTQQKTSAGRIAPNEGFTFFRPIGQVRDLPLHNSGRLQSKYALNLSQLPDLSISLEDSVSLCPGPGVKVGNFKGAYKKNKSGGSLFNFKALTLAVEG